MVLISHKAFHSYRNGTLCSSVGMYLGVGVRRAGSGFFGTPTPAPQLDRQIAGRPMVVDTTHALLAEGALRGGSNALNAVG